MDTRKAVIVLILLVLVVSVTFIVFQTNNTNSPPNVTIVTPIDDSFVSDSVTIQITVEDEESLTPDIYINDQYMATSLSIVWNTTSIANGEYSILANVTDSGGLSDNASIRVTVFNSHVTLNFTGEFKVMTYNIEESGINPDWKEVVKEEDPDIMILVETGTWDNNNDFLLNQAVIEFNAYFSQEAPYEGYTAQGIGFSTSGEAILSRFPILNFTQIPVVPLDDGTDYDVTHDFIHAVVDINGTNVNIIGVHLKASSGETNEHRREWETEGIINYMDELGEVPIMYMGDLNSFSPADTGDLAPTGDLGYGPLTMMLYPDDPVYGQFSSKVHNFTDVFRTLNPTDPGYTFGHTNPALTARIDYILVNSFFSGELINSTCDDTAYSDTGSDHYSVDAFIGWNSTSHSAGELPLFNQNTTDTELSNAGDDVNLIKPDGTTVQDIYCYVYSSNDVSCGRETDGGPISAALTALTPRARYIGLGVPELNYWILVEDFVQCVNKPVGILLGENEWWLD
ncbi:MAG: endonuclease/exonuclease/phosphatase family protein [Candidatus Thorarchaeota archaeon]|nr:endonuclease/exonuclease/phosphatase family protein [Candidatus Thorarchaeota archaeon]